MTAKMPCHGCPPAQQTGCELVRQPSTDEEPSKQTHTNDVKENYPDSFKGDRGRVAPYLNGYKNHDARVDLPTFSHLRHDSGIGLGSKPSSPTDERGSPMEPQKMEPSTSSQDALHTGNNPAKVKPEVKPKFSKKAKGSIWNTVALKSSSKDKSGKEPPRQNPVLENPPNLGNTRNVKTPVREKHPKSASREINVDEETAGFTFDELVEKDIETFESGLKSDTVFKNSRFVGQEIGPEGGHLELKSKDGSHSVHLIVPQGALHRRQPIYMAVNWETHGGSPRVRLGPSTHGKFKKTVYLKIPVYSDEAADLALIRRENENSEWIKDPETAQCLLLGDGAMLEISSFSDYMLIPQGWSLCRWVHVYVQQSSVGDGVMVRVYLTDDQYNEALTQRENGLFGKMMRRTNVYLGHQPLQLELHCDGGLKALDNTNHRDIPYSSLAHEEYGTAFLLRFAGDSRPTCTLKFKSAGCEVGEELPVPIVRIGDGLTARYRALINHDLVEQPLLQPNLLFPTEMVERLAGILDDREQNASRLAEIINMPVPMPIPTFRIRRFVSPTRCVLHFFQCLCRVKSYDKETSLDLLRQKLERLRLERASDVVREYQERQGHDPQEHTDTSSDTGAISKTTSNTSDLPSSDEKTVSSGSYTSSDDTLKALPSTLSASGLSKAETYEEASSRSGLGATAMHLSPTHTTPGTTGLEGKDEEPIYEDASSYWDPITTATEVSISSYTTGPTPSDGQDELIYDDASSGGGTNPATTDSIPQKRDPKTRDAPPQYTDSGIGCDQEVEDNPSNLS